jgi:Family of unknown function (DUF6476)
MHVPNPSQADAAASGPLSPGQVRALKIAVVVMGVLIIIGLFTVFARIIYLASRSGPQVQAASQASGKTAQRLALPRGAIVRQSSISGDRLAVQYEAPSGAGIVILDLASGQIVSRVELAPEAPRD